MAPSTSTPVPTSTPTYAPSATPSQIPTPVPTSRPSGTPSAAPSQTPSSQPTTLTGREAFSSSLLNALGVRAFLNSSQAPSRSLLPAALDIELEHSLLQGDAGMQAEQHGHVAFSLANGNFARDEIAAAYVVVMDLYGRVVAARPGEPYYLTSGDDVERGDDDVAGTGEHLSSLELRMRQILEEAGLLDADAPLPSGQLFDQLIAQAPDDAAELAGRYTAAREGTLRRRATAGAANAGAAARVGTLGPAYASRFEAVVPVNSSTLLLARRPLPTGAFLSEDDLNSPAQRFVLWNWKTGFEEPLLRTDEAPALSSTDVVYLSSTDVILGLASSAGGGAATDGADCVVEIARASSAVQWRWSWADACASYLEETVARAAYCASAPRLTHIDTAFEEVDGETEQMLYVSARELNAVIKVRRRDGAIVWMLGGEYSDFSLRASEGAAFRGQWAATKLEGDALLVFDNGVDTAADDDETDFVRASRFATVSFDEASGEARVSWSFDTAMHTKLFGSATRLPTGNVLGAAWPRSVLAPAAGRAAMLSDAKYDAVLYEAHPSGKLAWKLGVRVADNSTEPTRAHAAGSDGAPLGWSIYSASRVYTKPAITGVTVEVVPRWGWKITVSAYDTFRASSMRRGRAEARCYSSIEQYIGGVDFAYAAAWRKSEAEFEVDASTCVSNHILVSVTNADGVQSPHYYQTLPSPYDDSITFMPTASHVPSPAPTTDDTASPTEVPTGSPTSASPSLAPSAAPSTVSPTASPSRPPTSSPTARAAPSPEPSLAPPSPTALPTALPSAAPSQSPSPAPSAPPSRPLASVRPTVESTLSAMPTSAPSYAPSTPPSTGPSAAPSSRPSQGPSPAPSLTAPPSAAPSVVVVDYAADLMSVPSVRAFVDVARHHAANDDDDDGPASGAEASIGGSGESSLLLPEAIELEQRPDLVAGNLGKRALEGYIAFSLANGRFASDEVVAAYVVVMELSTGSIVATRVGEQYALASDADGDVPSNDTSTSATYVSRFETVKAYNATTLLLARKPLPASARGVSTAMRGADDDAASGDTQLGVGRARQFLLWNWRTGVEEPLRVGLENTGPEHMLSLGSTDVEHVAATSSMYVIGAERTLDSGDDDAASGGASLGSRVLEVTRADGATVWSWDWSTACSAHLASRSADDTYCDAEPGLTHVHAAREASSDAADDDADDGMHVERELMLYISARNLDAVIKVRRADGAIVWILGGARSDFALDDSAVSDAAPSDDADRDGGDHPAEGGVARASNATRLFCGQWSAEKLGDKPNLLIYDNGYDLAARAFRHATRFVTVEFDEEAMVARIIWSFDTGMRSLALGGALALPSGNVVGSAWPLQVVRPTHNGSATDDGGSSADALGDARYDAAVYEAHPSGRVAWKLGVLASGGEGATLAGVRAECNPGGASQAALRLCAHADSGAPLGWAIGAFERFYDAPLLGTLRADVASEDSEGFRGWLLNFDHLHDATRGDGASQPLGRISVSCQSQAAQVIGELSFRFAAGWAPASAGPLALALDDCIVSAITVTVSAAGVGDDVRHADDAHGSSSTYYYELPTAFDVEEFDAPAALSTSHNNPLAGLSLARVVHEPAERQLHMPRQRSRRRGSR